MRAGIPASVAAFGLCLAILYSMSGVALAQTKCPPQAEDPSPAKMPGVAAMWIGSPACDPMQLEKTAYETFFDSELPPTFRFMIALPDAAPSPASASPVKLYFTPSGGKSRANITEAVCANAAIEGIGTGSVTINLPEGTSCDLFVSAPAGKDGAPMSFEGNLTREGDSYVLTGATLTGDVFGGQVQQKAP